MPIVVILIKVNSEPDNKPEQQPDKPSAPNPMHFCTAGLEFMFMIALCTGGGYYLGEKLGWTASMTITGGLVGFSGGLYRLIRDAMKLHKNSCPPPKKPDYLDDDEDEWDRL